MDCVNLVAISKNLDISVTKWPVKLVMGRTELVNYWLDLTTSSGVGKSLVSSSPNIIEL